MTGRGSRRPRHPHTRARRLGRHGEQLRAGQGPSLGGDKVAGAQRLHGDVTVLIANDEAERWIAIERSLSALHGLDIYPELVEDTASLAALIGGRERANPTAVRRLAREPRQVLDIPRTIGITEIQRRLASILDEIAEGRPTAIYSSGQVRRRLHHPGRVLPPSQALARRRLVPDGGRDLATAETTTVVEFVRRFRDGSDASESAVG
jgi:hypothetical protein